MILLPKSGTPQTERVGKANGPNLARVIPARSSDVAVLRVLKSSWSSGERARVSFPSHLGCSLIPERDTSPPSRSRAHPVLGN